MPSSTQKESETEQRLPIQAAALASGLTPHVIRAWEKRYGAITPQRSDTRRRLYTQDEVKRLQLLRAATRLGKRISHVAQLSNEQLIGLIGNATPEDQADATTQRALLTPQEYIDTCINALKSFKPAVIENTLMSAANIYEGIRLLDDVVAPLLYQVGNLWRKGEIRLCHEHLCTATIRSFLGSMLKARNNLGAGPTLIVATPPGQSHDLGAMMAAIAANRAGWQAIYLSANVPIDEIVFAAVETKAKVVALGITYPGDDPHLPAELRKLRAELPEQTQIIVGGKTINSYRTSLLEINAVILNTLTDFDEHLDQVRINP